MSTSPAEREQWRRVSAVLDEVLDAPDDERAALLERLCAGDGALRAEVEALLAADHAAEARLKLPSFDRAGPAAGDLFGSWRLVRELGEGGMGRVYLAERADGQFSQRAAVKVLKSALWGEARERFVRERQILASLEHPSIARLLDGGVAQNAPFLVLEYVEGQPLTDWCAARKLGTRERVRLFLEVCRAVQFAHQHLVVHRDLKPANILVDANGRVKLLDFGIAKLLDEPEGVTATATRVMTPQYASPEQVRGERITTATDVHGLGAVLFELLTGRRAFDKGGPVTIEQAVVSQEPELPSNAAPAAIRRALRGDLDRIVLKAMEKPPPRRYQSALALAEDLERWLEGQPVLARRASLGYRAARFLRRHRVAATSAALIVAALIAGGASTLYQAREARAQSARAQAVASFMLSLFQFSDPAQAKGEKLSARELLDRGAQRVQTELAGQPEVQDVLFEQIGEVYLQLGAYPQAEQMARSLLELRRHLHGDRSIEVARALTFEGHVLYDENRYADAEQRYREAVELTKRERGEASRPYIEALWGLGATRFHLGDTASAERHRLEVAARWKALDGPKSGTYGQAVNSLGVHYLLLRQPAKAESYLREAFEIRKAVDGLENPSTLVVLYNLASAELELGRWDDGERHLTELRAPQEKLLGPSHPNVSLTKRALAKVLAAKGDFDGADALLDDALAKQRTVLGDGEAVAFLLVQLAAVKRERGELDAAAEKLREARRLLEGTPDAAWADTELALVLLERGDLDAAAERLTAADAEGKDRPRDAYVADTIAAHGRLALARGERDTATKHFDDALALLSSLGLAESTQAAQAKWRRASIDGARSEAKFREALATLRSLWPADHSAVVDAEVAFARALLDAKRCSDARALLVRALDARTRRNGVAHPRTREASTLLAQCPPATQP